MTITPISFVNDGVDIAVDADLSANYPNLSRDIWDGQTSYRTQLKQAFEKTLRDVTANDSFSDQSLIPSSATNKAWFKQTTIEAAYSKIFLSFMVESNDRWHVLHQYHEKQYLSRIQNIRIDYDTDESGAVADGEEKIVSVVEFMR